MQRLLPNNKIDPARHPAPAFGEGRPSKCAPTIMIMGAASYLRPGPASRRAGRHLRDWLRHLQMDRYRHRASQLARASGLAIIWPGFGIR